MMNKERIKLLSGHSISYNTKHGAEIYRRSLIVLMQAVIKSLYPGLKVQMGQTLMHGYYFEAPDQKKLPEKFIQKVAAAMKKEAGKNKKFRRKTIGREEALKLFSESGRPDKVKALQCLNEKKIELVFLNGYFDYMLTECVERTGSLKTFNLINYKDGFILQFPGRGDINKLPVSPGRQEHLYKVYKEKKRWDDVLGVRIVSDLVEVIQAGQTEDIIKIQESFHTEKIELIADKIRVLYPKKQLIFISGPSSSGKTTFIKRLGLALRSRELIPHEISLDDFFHPRHKTPKTEDGDYDFESIDALDLELFKICLNRLFKEGIADMPEFDFKTGCRKKELKSMKLEKNPVILVEGIHGLNPELTGGITDKENFGIFVSALTQLCIDNDTRIFTSDSRLMRRIVRDNLFRGHSAYETIKRFPKVRDGEDKFIFPYQARADVFFNSSLIYEQAVLKPHLEKLLNKIPEEKKEYYEARRILRYLEYFKAISSDTVPDNSILREFIGKSRFEY